MIISKEELLQELRNRNYVKDMPDIISEAQNLLKKDFPDIDDATILNFLVCNLIRMFSSKKITIDEAGNKVLLNWFALIFMSSGDGKDRIASIIDSYFLRGYKNWFTNEANSVYEVQIAEYKQMLAQKEQDNKDNNRYKKGEENYGNITTSEHPF